MGMTGARLHLRLFLDGLEIPVVGARCTYAEGQPATAEIQIVATDQVHDIPPRSCVTLFYYDNYDFTPSGERLGPYDLRRYKLLFLGEVAGLQFQKTHVTRSAILMCVDPTNYWDYIKQHYVNFRNGGIELFENAFLGVKATNVKNFDVVTKGVHSNLFVWLTNTKINGQPNMFAGVQRMLREMFFASNNFYAQAFNRLRLGDQIVGVPNDTTAAKLFKLQFFEKFIKNQVGGAGGFITARQMVQMLLAPVYYTTVTVPGPKFDESGEAAGFRPDRESDLGKQIIPREKFDEATLNYTVIKPDTWFMAPPVANVIFPHQYSQFSYQRHYLQEPTRLFMRTQLLFTGRDKWLTERFYAPDFEEFNQLLNLKGGYLDRLASVLLPHEQFTGLNPIFNWQSDLSTYVAPGPRREYLAHLAHYLFWKYRYGTRTANVSGPFNPNLIPGYPGVVFEKVGGVPETRADGSNIIPRHYVGNIQVLVHVVDQNGGMSHVTMAGVRAHDEDADFDGQGRSLEEVTNKGADGFFDDRYDTENIGPGVYQPLFGCDSIMDEFNIDEDNVVELTTQSGRTYSSALFGTIAGAVEYLHETYRVATEADADIHNFSETLQHRPKANLIDVIGVPEFWNATEHDAASIAAISENRDSLEGFLSSAVDLFSSAFGNDTYTATQTSIVPSIKETQATETIPGTDLKKLVTKKTNTSVTTEKDQTGSYELLQQLAARREKVQLYVDSLRFRGSRG